MLSRQALANQLPDYIRFFSPTVEISGSTTPELLDNLIQALWYLELADADNALYATEEDKASIIRTRLEIILQNPLRQELHDKAFALQLLLARTYPILSLDDPVLIDPNTPLIFFSNGAAFPKTYVKEFYRQSHCYNGDGEYLHIVSHEPPLSLRELMSLQQQGVRFIEEPSHAEKIGKTVGKAFGLFCLLGLYAGAVFILPFGALAASLVVGVMSLISVNIPTLRTRLRTTVTRTNAFLTGVILAVSVMAALSIAFPPVAALLVTAGLITSGAAAVATTYFTLAVLPGVPLLVAAASIVVGLIREIPVPDVVHSWARVPTNAIIGMSEITFALFGRLVNFLGKALLILPNFPPQPPVVEDDTQALPVVVDDTQALLDDYDEIQQQGLANQQAHQEDSTQAILLQMRFASNDGGREQKPEPALNPLPSAFNGHTSAQPHVFPTTGSYRLGETSDEREDRLSMTR